MIVSLRRAAVTIVLLVGLPAVAAAQLVRGTIVDQGTHAELLPRCKMYSRLYQAQLREAA